MYKLILTRNRPNWLRNPDIHEVCLVGRFSRFTCYRTAPQIEKLKKIYP